MDEYPGAVWFGEDLHETRCPSLMNLERDQSSLVVGQGSAQPSLMQVPRGANGDLVQRIVILYLDVAGIGELHCPRFLGALDFCGGGSCILRVGCSVEHLHASAP